MNDAIDIEIATIINQIAANDKSIASIDVGIAAIGKNIAAIDTQIAAIDKNIAFLKNITRKASSVSSSASIAGRRSKQKPKTQTGFPPKM